jgi:hypothetical protein
MKDLDNYYRTQLIRHQTYLDEPDDPEPEPCPYCSHDLDADDDCHNPDCPNE